MLLTVSKNIWTKLNKGNVEDHVQKRFQYAEREIQKKDTVVDLNVRKEMLWSNSKNIEEEERQKYNGSNAVGRVVDRF